jgi:copper chaperone NosL
MRAIEPADMPELKYMRWVVLALAVAGLVAAAVGRRRWLYAWTATFVIAGVAGMADFWWRSYSFGHTLDLEHAAIQIPGQAYQPPLIGVKQIANFTASAWPASGGIALGIVAILAVLAVWRTRGLVRAAA